MRGSDGRCERSSTRSIRAVRITTRTMPPSCSVRASSVRPVRSQQRVDPAVLEGDRSGQGLGHHDETAAHDEREPPIEPSRGRVRRSSRARAVEAEQPEVLRGKVVTHQQVVQDGEPDHALGQRHRQHALGSQQQGEAGHGDGQRGHDEAQPLRGEQRAVGRGRVGQPGRRDAVAEPQGHREGEEQPVHRAGAHVVMTPRQQKDQRGQPQRIQDPDEVPGRALDPARGGRRQRIGPTRRFPDLRTGPGRRKEWILLTTHLALPSKKPAAFSPLRQAGASDRHGSTPVVAGTATGGSGGSGVRLDFLSPHR